MITNIYVMSIYLTNLTDIYWQVIKNLVETKERKWN